MVRSGNDNNTSGYSQVESDMAIERDKELFEVARVPRDGCQYRLTLVRVYEKKHIARDNESSQPYAVTCTETVDDCVHA